LLAGHHWRLSLASSFAPIYVHGLAAEQVQLLGGTLTLPLETA
jgi:hypothetical protein